MNSIRIANSVIGVITTDNATLTMDPMPKEATVSEWIEDNRISFYELIWQKLLIHGAIQVSLRNGRQLRVSIVGDSFAAE